jgi:ketosteroid isomerase-like protein
MAVYAEDATFVVVDGVIRGKAAIAARYAPRFAPEAAAKRGTLSFEQMAFRPIDPSHALLVARYRLKIAGAADQTGPTSLLFEKQREGWKIVADHSS